MFELAYTEWKQKSQKFELRNNPFIDGKFINAHSGQTYQMYDPVSENLLATVASCDRYDVNRAIQSALQVYKSKGWIETPFAERKVILNALIELVVDNKEELALLETLDMGKQAVETLHLDRISASAILRWYAKGGQEYLKALAFPKNMDTLNEPQPSIGVVGVIIPCNFPLHQILCNIFPLLLAGNSIVIKPPIESPHGVLRVAELSAQAGLPNGVLNVLPGFTHKTGKAIAFHHDIDKLFFYLPWGSKVCSVNFGNPLKRIKQGFSGMMKSIFL